MALSKTEQVKVISQRLNMPQGFVNQIITDYTNYVKYELKQFGFANFLGIVVIHRKGEAFTINNMRTIAMQCHNISRERGIGYQFIRGVLDHYLDLIVTELVTEGKININGFATLKYEGGRTYVVSSWTLPKGHISSTTEWLTSTVNHIASSRMIGV